MKNGRKLLYILKGTNRLYNRLYNKAFLQSTLQSRIEINTGLDINKYASNVRKLRSHTSKRYASHQKKTL